MTRVRTSALLAILVCGLAFPGGVSAHHSIQAQFDVNKTLTISGAVAKVEFIQLEQRPCAGDQDDRRPGLQARAGAWSMTRYEGVYAFV